MKGVRTINWKSQSEVDFTMLVDCRKYFGNVAYIQRYNTYHGAAPPLKSGDKKGQIRKSQYTCDYAYYVPLKD